ncbi:MAG: SPASM domain-containing protein [Phycisphaerae bacterium]|jgi:MoaA/NifB/PqqE/SkfB family radical SAM enzyme
MKTIAAILADLEVTPLGTRSRLTDELRGIPVLRRTVDRVAGARGVESVHVLCPETQTPRCKRLLGDADALVIPVNTTPPAWASLARTGCKWSLDGWRGGIGGTTHFEEFVDGRLLAELLDSVEADAVLSVHAAAPLVDVALIDRMIRHHQTARRESRLTFTQAPPGLAGIVLDAPLVRELAEKNVPLGWVLSYKPDTPQKDLVFQTCCLEVPPEVRYAVGRLTADTERSFRRLVSLLDDHDDPDLETIGRWLTQQESATTEPSPREVEIELTTDDPYPDAPLVPRGSRVEKRGPIDLKIVERIVGELIRYDDSLVVLGGFGDPLRHPQFGQVLRSIRGVQADGKRLFGLAVRTRGADLTREHIEAMFDHGVDVLEVALDAWTPELYGRLQSPSDPSAARLEDVLHRVEQLSAMRRQRQAVQPIVVPSMVKARENVHELDDFHDGWIRRLGAVTIHGVSHYARQFEDRSVIQMAPKPRVGCRRLRCRCMVLADGRATMCDQDFNGRHALGSLREHSLEQLWNGATFNALRDAHRKGRFDLNPLCPACDEWHRP